MNVQQRPTAGAESRERPSYARVPRSFRLLARGGWLVLVILTLATFGASLPTYVALLHTPCPGSACEWQQLTPAHVETLTGMGLSPSDYAACILALTLATVVVSLGVSIVIVWRRSNDRMAFLVALLLAATSPMIATTAVITSPFPWRVPNEGLTFLGTALLVLVFLLFPSGQFVPSFTRWIFVVFLAVQAPIIFLQAPPLIPNAPVSQPGWLVAASEFATVALVQLYRYRRVSSPRERQQTKWVIFGLSVPITVNVIVTVLYLIFPMVTLSGSIFSLAYNVFGACWPLLIPLSFGFAMLRARLWDIDVLIKRTLVYGALTVSLTGICVGLVIGLSVLLRGLISQENSVAIVLSTLASVVLSQPLRRRIQRLIDRRFYHHKYDAARTVAEFSAALRQEVDLRQLSEQLVAVVQETMQPAHVSLWLRPPESSRKQKTLEFTRFYGDPQ
jgi:hypothetical protein